MTLRLAIPMRKPFVALEEALQAAGCEIVRDPHAAAVAAVIVDFCDAARSPLATRLLARSSGARPMIALARDAPWHKGVRAHKLWLTARLRPFSLYASHSLQDADRFASRVLYFPNAAWLPHYGLHGRTLAELRDPARYRHQVSFIGNVDAERFPEHRARVEFLRALAERLRAHAITLDLIDSSRGLAPAEQVRIIQCSRINLNHGAACDHEAGRSWGLPERCYGVPAAGGFLLSDARRHARDDFDPAREWADYADLDTCVERIRFYIERFDATRAIAEAAHARVIRDHTYARRAATLIDAITRLREA